MRTELAAAVTLGGPAAPLVARSSTGLRIVSPREGDVYGIPPGTDSRYATIALRAAGAAQGEALRWLMDGRPVTPGRWGLIPGRHVVRVETRSGEYATASFEVR